MESEEQMEQLNVNWSAIVIGFAAFLVWTLLSFGRLTQALWKPLMERAKLKPLNPKERPFAFPVMALGTFFSTFALYLVVYYAHIDVWWMGLCAGAMVWIGFGAVATLFSMSMASIPLSMWIYGFIVYIIPYAGLGVLFSVWR